VVRPLVWNEPPDDERVRTNLETHMPVALDYLEGEVPAGGFLFGTIGVADISIATFFRNGAYAGFTPDPDRWPKVAAFVERVLSHRCIATLLPFEEVQRNAEIRSRRRALLDAGAPLTDDTLGLREPRRGYVQL
jgi:glutathione S-transferase